jgi:tetratricopeptide (TPR) repeat protein
MMLARVAVLFVLVFVGAGAATAYAAAAAAAAAPAAATAISPVEQAQKLYDAAKFTEAVARLREALSTGQVTGSEVVEARALLGRCLVKTGERLEARQAFQTVLRMDPAYRPNSVVVPPDEMDVFNLALKAVTAEEIEAGQRIPASLMFFYGSGPGDNESLGEVQKHFGGSSTLDVQPEFGGSVRFPLRPRFSLDIEVSRLRATGKSDSTAASVYIHDTKYEAAAIPLVLSLYWTALPRTKYRANLFVGAGRLLAANNSIDMHYKQGTFYDFRFLQGDTKTGTYFHVGGEGEYMLHPKVSLSGRVLYRSATAKELIHQGTGLLSAIDPGIPIFKDRKVDFSGVAFTVGLRAYIGY